MQGLLTADVQQQPHCSFIVRCDRREQVSYSFVSDVFLKTKNQVCKNVTMSNTEIRVRLALVRLPEENFIRPSTAG